MGKLATRFGHVSLINRNAPLSDDDIRSVAPSIYAADRHASRSDRYTYIPTSDIIRGLRKEGFLPFMACQSRTRAEDRREHTKHMLRLRREGEICHTEAKEIVLINSHGATISGAPSTGCRRTPLRAGSRAESSAAGVVPLVPCPASIAT